MSNTPAYHLRPNKAVERFLFVELLRKLDGKLLRPLAQYRYVGLGGPYLEDFNLVHSAFALKDMVSLELAKHILTRQRINQPASCIRLTTESTTKFTEDYVPGKIPLIVWYDYSNADWKNQLAECCELIQKLPPLSVFKVTLTGGIGGDIPARKAEKFNQLFGDYGSFEGIDMGRKQIASTLYKVCRRAIADAVPDAVARCVRSLASYRYDDGTPILTVTMLVGSIADVEEVIGKARLREWPFANLDWTGPTEIAVPQLGLRERLSVQRLLPGASSKTIVKKLKLRLEESYSDSVQAMERYVQFNRQVPHFLRVAL